MRLGNVFPRNPDGTLKHKKPCQTPGCDWPNWHICLDKTDPGYTQMHPVKKSKSMPESQRRAIAEAQRQRHAERRALTKERDDLIIKHYMDGSGMSHISSNLGIAYSTVNKVLQRAQREGVLRIRPANFTYSRPAR